MIFASTTHCTSSTHCQTCRDLEGGRAWRKSLAKVFDLPGGEIDFDCPHGHPWGFEGNPKAKPKMTINQLAAKKRNCVSCAERTRLKNERSKR